MISSEIESTTNIRSPEKNEGKQFKMKVLMATSLDSRHGIENIVDGRINTFWISTGLFPQEIIIALSASVLLKTVTLTTMKVSHVILESSNTNIKEFRTVNSQEIQDGTIQTTSFAIPPNTKAKFLKFIFKKGYSDFITVHKLNVTGDPIIESTTTSSTTTTTTTTNKEKSSKSSKSRSEHKSNGDDNKDKILVRQNIDSSSSIKINNSNNNSTTNLNTSSSTSKHKKKSLTTTEDSNLTDINTELQTSYSMGTRRESRRLTRMTTHNATDSNNNGSSGNHHSKEKKNSSSTKLKENSSDDN